MTWLSWTRSGHRGPFAWREDSILALWVLLQSNSHGLWLSFDQLTAGSVKPLSHLSLGRSFVSQMEEEAEKQEASPLPTERRPPVFGDITMVGHKTSLGGTNG